MKTLDAFTRSYITTALWIENDESTEAGGEPFDANYSIEDIAPETLEAMIRDCEAFQRDNEEDLQACYGTVQYSREITPESAGHDFWLTRCGHGAGFWDGDYPEPQASRLTEAAQVYQSFDLYLGDDGRIHS